MWPCKIGGFVCYLDCALVKARVLRYMFKTVYLNFEDLCNAFTEP